MKVQVIHLGYDVFFISHTEPIKSGDYYISWGLFTQDYKLSKSNRGEYPKCPHGKVIASTKDLFFIPTIGKEFLDNFYKVGRIIEEAELLTEKVTITNFGLSDGEPETEMKLAVTANNEVIVSSFVLNTEMKVNDFIVTEPEVLKIKVTTEEIINAKFNDTLVTIEGYLKEAEGDISVDQDYSANAVFERLLEIKNALLNDLKKMAKSVTT
jgi:hypothetical protein